MNEPMIFAGADVCLCHVGAVALNTDGKVIRVGWVSSTKSDGEIPDGHPVRKESIYIRPYLLDFAGGNDVANARRLYALRGIFADLVSDMADEGDVLAIENYAFSQPAQAHQIGEAGGQFKLAALARDLRLRLHVPSVLKEFATGHGGADKSMMLAAAAKDGFCVLDWLDWQPPAKEPKKPKKASAKPPKAPKEPKQWPSKQTVEDLCDAYWLAKMALAEWQLREGIIVMSDLPRHQIKAFNTVRGKNEVNLLARPWITLED